MRRLGVNEQCFVNEYEAALHDNSDHSFGDLIGKHAASMISLALDLHAKNHRGGMKTWAKIDRLSDKWVALVCPVADQSEFYRITDKLVRGYTDLLGDCITGVKIDKKDLKNLDEVSVGFYRRIATHKAPELRRMWKHYTRSLVDMSNVLNAQGKSDNFYSRARESIIAGSLLGAELDHSLSSR